jgi:hypothetical protein
VKLEVQQKGASKAALDLRALGLRASDVRKVGTQIGRVVAASNKRRFDSRGGGKWPALATSTKEKKARQGDDPRILRASGQLYKDLTSTRPLKADTDELVFGTKLRYAHFSLGTKNEPRRDPIQLRVSDRREITRIISRYVVKGRR